MGNEWPVAIEGLEPVDLIGSGGFGDVWLARQTDLDRQVAVKIGHRPLVNDDDRRRFERECKALGRLSGHHHIIDVYTSGLSNGLPYLVLAYVEGGTLADHGPSLGEARLRVVTDQLCQAVVAAHSIGVLHRDLKPENVFLETNGSVVLGDFGIARLGDGNNTAASGVTASMAFAAPEILEGRPPAPAADVYGVGVTIVSAILGRSPFTSEHTTTLEAIIALVLQADPPPLSPYGISPQFEALLRRAMAKDPAHRPASAEALLAELRQLPQPGGTTTHVAPHASPQQPQATTGQQPGYGTSAPVAQHYTTGQPAAAYQPPGTVSGGPVVAPVGYSSGPPSGQTQQSKPSNMPLIIGVAAAAVVLLVLIGALINSLTSNGGETVTATDDTGSEGEGEADPDPDPVVDESSTTSSSSTSTSAPALTPLALPLTGSDISIIAPIPVDFDDLDPLLGPADSPQFCDQRPDITGMTETLAAVYPRDPTEEASLRQVAQRLHRFTTPEQASNFIESYTTFDCTSWESDDFTASGTTVLTAEVVPPTVIVGDEIVQVDQVANLPIGVALHSRTVLVRSGVDVYKLFFITLEQTELQPLTDEMLIKAIEILRY